MNDTVLLVSGAAKRFGDIAALAGVDLALRRGEWLGLLGPNGAGKTTLVRAVAGRVRLDAGTVTLLGEATGPANGARGSATSRGSRKLGVVPQEVAIYPLLTARENLEAFGSLHGVAGAALRERVDWALEWTGLADRARQVTKGFSGGMKRRLNLAASVLHRPEVLLLDEPTSGVDPQSRERIWEMLAELRAAGTSLLLTTHQLDEAQQVCERIVIIDGGKVIAEGTLDELVARTLGRQRRVRLRLAQPLPDGDALGAEVGEGGRELAFAVAEVGAELPGILERVVARGGRVEDVHVQAPTLHAVFLHLTGRELRE